MTAPPHSMQIGENRIFVLAASALLLLLVCSGCAKDQTTGLEIDIMSFNIRYGTARDEENHWEKRKDLVIEVTRNHRPDIVGLQEALRFQIDEILDALPRYAFVGIGRDPGGGGEYSAILYDKSRFQILEQDTFWLSDTPGTPSASWGNKIVRICTWARFEDLSSEHRFYVFNTHFDHQSEISRTQSSLLLAERIANRKYKKDPYLVTGDFNAGEDTQAIRSLLGKAQPAPHFDEAPLIDPFRVIHSDAENVGTFNRWTGAKEEAKIDYVFVSPKIEVVDAKIIHDNRDGRYPSDHYPVSARVRLK